MKNALLKQAVQYIFKTPFFKLVLLVFLLITVGLLLIQEEVVFPIFQRMQKTSVISPLLEISPSIIMKNGMERGIFID